MSPTFPAYHKEITFIDHASLFLKPSMAPHGKRGGMACESQTGVHEPWHPHGKEGTLSWIILNDKPFQSASQIVVYGDIL